MKKDINKIFNELLRNGYSKDEAMIEACHLYAIGYRCED